MMKNGCFDGKAARFSKDRVSTEGRAAVENMSGWESKAMRRKGENAKRYGERVQGSGCNHYAKLPPGFHKEM